MSLKQYILIVYNKGTTNICYSIKTMSSNRPQLESFLTVRQTYLASALWFAVVPIVIEWQCNLWTKAGTHKRDHSKQVSKVQENLCHCAHHCANARAITLSSHCNSMYLHAIVNCKWSGTCGTLLGSVQIFELIAQFLEQCHFTTAAHAIIAAPSECFVLSWNQKAAFLKMSARISGRHSAFILYYTHAFSRGQIHLVPRLNAVNMFLL